MQVEGHKNSPLSVSNWADFLQKATLSVAFLLLASAGICWIAANWEQASAFQKLVGVQTSLVAFVLMAWWLVYVSGADKGQKFSFSAHMTGLAAVATGGLLALVGQIYQTGADPWELFLLWAVLLIPWLLVMRTVFLGVLFAVLLNVAAGLYLGISHGSWWAGFFLGMRECLLVSLMNVVLLVLWESSIAWLDDRWRVGPRMLGIAAMAWLVVAALIAMETSQGPHIVAMLGLFATGLMYWVYTSKRPDFPMVCLAVLTAFTLVMISLIRLINSEEALLLIVAVAIVLAGLVLRHLRALLRSHHAASGSDQHAVSVFREPWFLGLFRLFIMGITAGLLILYLFLVFDLRLAQFVSAGLVMCAGGVWVFRASTNDIPREAGMTLMATGLILAGAGLFMMADDHPRWGVVALLLLFGALLYVLAASVALRFLTAFYILALVLLLTWGDDSVYWLLNVFDYGYYTGSNSIYVRLWWLGAGAVFALVVASRSRNPAFWTPLAWALACQAQIAAWLAPIVVLSDFAALRQGVSVLFVYWLACAVLPVLILAGVLWRARDLHAIVRIGAPIVLAVASVGWMGTSGIAMALVWLILGYAFGLRTLLVFGVLALLASLSRFYYAMDSTLLQKSLVLSLTGGWLLLSWYVLHKFVCKSGGTDTNADGQASQKAGSRQVWREAGLLAGLVLILLAVNTGIYQREQILATGQRVVLALAPVDPRSLMQGDYMALRFSVAVQLRHQLMQNELTELEQEIKDQQGGYLLLVPDEDGVHRLSKLMVKADTQALAQVNAGVQALAQARTDAQALDQENAPAAALLEFRLRDRDVRIVTDAWFFPEGQAERFEFARYGEFRVDGKGKGLLMQLLDEQFQPLPEAVVDHTR